MTLNKKVIPKKPRRVRICGVGVGARLRTLMQTMFMRHSAVLKLKALCDESEEVLRIVKEWPYKYQHLLSSLRLFRLSIVLFFFPRVL
jgi:hypothetical protein